MRDLRLPGSYCLSIISTVFVGTSACYPGGIDNYEDTDVVVTVRVDGVDYASLKTYAMPDEVVDLCEIENPSASDDDYDDGVDCTGNRDTRFDSLMLDTVRSNLQALGYTEEQDPENNAVDTVVLVGAAKTNRYSYEYYCEWWWYYWGYWPGWGPYPPPGAGGGWYCPGYPSVTVFTVGSVIVTMVDPSQISEDSKRIPVLWNAAMNGLAGSSGSTTANRITTSIDQAFTQSPYLGGE